MTPEEAAKKRSEEINKRQEELEEAVILIQLILYQILLENIERISEDPTKIDPLYRSFIQAHHLPVIRKYAQDILALTNQNAAYFRSILGSKLPANFDQIKTVADTFIQNQFGITAGGYLRTGGHLYSFVEDESIKREIKQYAYRNLRAPLGFQRFKQGLKQLIQGSPETGKGAFQKYYQSNAYDTYNQADAAIQDYFSQELNMQAALYVGGLIETSREFCIIRNGKVFIKSEIEKFGTSSDKYGGYTDKVLGKFSGKTVPYNPFTDRGGANCRHDWHYITNEMALERRKDLREVGGKLIVI